MTKMDQELIAGFLEQEFDGFAAYLDDHDIEPSEAGVMIEHIKNGDIND